MPSLSYISGKAAQINIELTGKYFTKFIMTAFTYKILHQKVKPVHLRSANELKDSVEEIYPI